MLFAKLFRSQYDSSIANNYVLRWVFNDMVILSDMEGFLDMTHESISRITGVPLEIIRTSIDSLMSDDPNSRCKDHGGKRLIPMLDDDGNPRPWGWQIVNKPYYMKIRDAETMRERNRLRQQRHRDKTVTKKRDKSVTVTPRNASVTGGHAASRPVTPNKSENENKKESFPASAGGPTHSRIYYEEAAKAGIVVAPQVADFSALAKVFHDLGDEAKYREVCSLYFLSHDKFVIENGFSGRHLPGKLQAILNFAHKAKPLISDDENARRAAAARGMV